MTLRRLVSILVVFSALFGVSTQAGLYEDRFLYKQALSALKSNRISQFEQHVAELEDYPLVPYLKYLHALKSVRRTSVSDAVAFRDAMSEYTFGKRYMSFWLSTQASLGNWQNYANYYHPTSDIVAQCRYAMALIRTGERDAAYRLLPQLWNVEKSQDKSCDPAFEVWIRDAGIPAELAWERLKKTLTAGQYQLSRYLFRFLPEKVRTSADAMYKVRRNPKFASNIHRFPNDRWGNDAYIFGLSRLARNEPTTAFSLWSKHRATRAFNESQTRSSVSDLYLWLGLKGHIGLPPHEGLTSQALHRVIHSAISQGAWQEAAAWLQQLPEEELAKYEWRYWRAKVEQTLGNDTWREPLQALAQIRTYYGFLAAQELGQPINLNERRYVPDLTLEAQLDANPHARMVLEFFAVGEPTNGRREWQKLAESLNNAEKMVMIQLFNAYGLSGEAIYAANRGEMLNFLEARFPTPFLSYFKQGAFVTDTPLSFLLALSRQESAFDHRAISTAGARGLMQLMLRTAQSTARKHRLTKPTADDLLDPRHNVALGSFHVADLASEFDDNRVLIAAAYNAGKMRTYTWLRDYKVKDTASFVEIIPFRETREYVKGILAFAVVYASRHGEQAQLLANHELQLPAHLVN